MQKVARDKCQLVAKNQVLYNTVYQVVLPKLSLR